MLITFLLYEIKIMNKTSLRFNNFLYKETKHNILLYYSSNPVTQQFVATNLYELQQMIGIVITLTPEKKHLMI